MSALQRGTPASVPLAGALAARYASVRERSVQLIALLSSEDACAQSMPDASPSKWHLAHVTWFFETFVLEAHEPRFKPFRPEFRELFNSYYNGIGNQFPRAMRGLLTRPTLDEILAYRADVDRRMAQLFERAVPASLQHIELGLAHEEQHQELLLMDLKHLLSLNPLNPAYRAAAQPSRVDASKLEWIAHEAGIVEIGHPSSGFHFDNEAPRHRVLLAPFLLASRPVTNGEYLEFMQAGAYRDPRWWLADGWNIVRREGWQAPAYWRECDGQWHEFTLGGLEPLDRAAPVCHVSHYEADAYAAWAQARLPTEFEWEAAAQGIAVDGNFVDSGYLHPRAAQTGAVNQLFGDTWEWTSSAYLAYPGFKVAAGAVGEYNGKFMSNQIVLKGGCCVTPRGHVRASYRNFFYPHQRWAFSGIRLARDS
jgi:ergothioneine biosynthesis protein EgtB